MEGIKERREEKTDSGIEGVKYLKQSLTDLYIVPDFNSKVVLELASEVQVESHYQVGA